MTHEIIVDIKEDGETTVGVNGVAGPTCKEVTRKIEAALGKTVCDSSTAEMQKAPEQGQQVSQ